MLKAYETGFSTLLLLLAGTLPVSFRGTQYKFPVAIWIPTTYPREPPMVYVTPTHDMVVRVGQHVTLEGRVYHHYLAHWLEAWDVSTPGFGVDGTRAYQGIHRDLLFSTSCPFYEMSLQLNLPSNTSNRRYRRSLHNHICLRHRRCLHYHRGSAPLQLKAWLLPVQQPRNPRHLLQNQGKCLLNSSSSSSSRPL